LGLLKKTGGDYNRWPTPVKTFFKRFSARQLRSKVRFLRGKSPYLAPVSERTGRGEPSAPLRCKIIDRMNLRPYYAFLSIAVQNEPTLWEKTNGR
jgi:hypothetical protein